MAAEIERLENRLWDLRYFRSMASAAQKMNIDREIYFLSLKLEKLKKEAGA